VTEVTPPRVQTPPRLPGRGGGGFVEHAVELAEGLADALFVFDHGDADIPFAFRAERPAVDLDLRLGSGFDRLDDLVAGALDLVVTPDAVRRRRLRFEPLFAYRMLLICAPDHRLAGRKVVRAADLARETLITHPVSTCRLDVYTRLLEPAGVLPARRLTSELTAVIEQKVASGQGVAALPEWTVGKGLHSGRIVAVDLGRGGMRSRLYAAYRADASAEHAERFVHLARRVAGRQLPGVELLAR